MFGPKIRETSKRTNALHQAVHQRFKQRNVEPEAWREACRQFATYASPIDDWVEAIYEKQGINGRLLEFCIQFLEIDPYYFRSGYLKEKMLTRLKSVSLGAYEVARLRMVFLKATQNGWRREFIYYCRLAAKLGDDILVENLNRQLEYDQAGVVTRTQMMLAGYIASSHN